MRDVHEAMAVLRAAIGLSDIGFERSDHFDLIVEDRLKIDFHRVGASEIELAAAIAPPQRLRDPAALQARLTAQHLGRDTGAARFALDPNDGSEILCRRIETGACDDRAFVAAVLGFIRSALAESDRRPGRPAPVPAPAAQAPWEMEFRIRV